MTLGIVFVNYFSTDLIAERIRSYAGADVEAVVVDNSGDYRGPGVVAGDGTNIGFGSACNLGVRELDPSIGTVILHNPDVYPTIGALEEIAARVSHDGVGIVAPALVTPDGPVIDGYSYPRLSAELVAGRGVGRIPSAAEALASDPSGGRRFLRSASRAISRGSRFGSAALLAVDVEAFDDIGGFDERYILYGEDLDLWHRMNASGGRVVFANDVSAFHERGSGSPASRQTRELLRFAGVQLFAQLHHGNRWKLFRAVHRRALAAVEPDNQISEMLHREWASGADPIATSRALRACFLDGVMAESGSSPPSDSPSSIREPGVTT